MPRESHGPTTEEFLGAARDHHSRRLEPEAGGAGPELEKIYGAGCRELLRERGVMIT